MDALWEVADDPELWVWSVADMSCRNDIVAYVDEALASAASGDALPFVTCLADDGRVIGSTRFGTYVPEHEHVEIGWTWLGRPWQRSAVNTEAKLLMLGHAFETLGVARLEFKTDRMNEVSRNAIARLGAREEGTLRAHMVAHTGRSRDSVYFSILRAEWPAVRERLEARLARG